MGFLSMDNFLVCAVFYSTDFIFMVISTHRSVYNILNNALYSTNLKRLYEDLMKITAMS